MAASPAATMSCSAQVGWGPHDLVAREADLGRFLQGRRGHDASAAQDDPVGLGHFDPQPGRLLVEPRRVHGRCCTAKPYWAAWVLRMGRVSRPKSYVDVDMGDLHALELLHAASPLGDEPDLGRVLAPPVAWGGKIYGNTRPSKASARPMPSVIRGILSCATRSVRA